MAAQRRLSLTTRGKAALALFAVAGLSALLAGDPLSRSLAALSAALLIASLAAARAVAHVAVRAVAPLQLVEGETRVLDLAVAAPGLGTSPGLELKLRMPELLGRGFVAIARRAPGAPAALPLRALRLGLVRAVPLHVETQSPLGLVRASAHRTIPAQILVLPRPRALREHRLEEWLALRPRGTDLPQPTGPGDAEFFAVREFRDGDPERRVHPRLSARRGRKVLRVFRGEAPPRVELLFDPRVRPQRVGYQRVDFEEAIRFCAGLVRALLLRGTPVDLDVIGARGIESLCSARSRVVDAYLARLAGLRPLPSAPGDVEIVLPHPPADGVRRLVVHLGRLDERALPPRWIAIQAGSRRYYQLLEPVYHVADRR